MPYLIWGKFHLCISFLGVQLAPTSTSLFSAPKFLTPFLIFLLLSLALSLSLSHIDFFIT